MTQTTSEITHEISKSAITLDKLAPATFKKDMLQAQIRQVVTTTSNYPTQRVASNMQESLFDVAEFGIESKPYESVEKRVAFIFVPKTKTEEQVKAGLAIATANGGSIYKVLSNAPILDDNQEAGINAGLITKDIIANSQVVRYSAGHELEGQLITDPQGRVQYRRTFFWKTAKEDVDVRGNIDHPEYVTSEIQAELEGASVLKGQTV